MEKKVRLLLVEDSAFQRKRLRLQIEAQGYEVLEAASGEEAEAELRRSRPDAVLLDWELPDVEGPELIRRWARDHELRWVPVLMVTSHGDPESILRALDSGAVDFVRKPPDEVELVARLRAALRVRRLQEQLREMAIRDPLTGLYNRRHLQERLREEFSRASRHNHPFSLAIIDLDHFKQVNDTHGHDCGDVVLQQLSEHLRQGLRTSDVLARYGGEEFVMLLPETPHAMALTCLERLHRAMGDRTWGADGKGLRLTFSSGVATFPSPGIRSTEDLLKAADGALYAAKAAGRDRVVSALTLGS